MNLLCKIEKKAKRFSVGNAVRVLTFGMFVFACTTAALGQSNGNQLTSTTISPLAEGFKSPSNEARPRAFWNWINGAVSNKSLTRDMEEAKAKGMGGLDIWDVGALRNADGFVPAGPPFLSEESVKSIKHAFKEAKRLDLELGMIASSGWNAGGPWVAPKFQGKGLYYSETVVRGSGKVKKELPFPEVPQHCPKGDDGLPLWYIDVAVLAWPDNPDKVITDRSEIINLTDKVKDGKVKWTVPKGKWRIVRYVCTNNGQQLIAASPNSEGPFIDFLDPEATIFHLNYIINKLGLKKGGDSELPLKYFEFDSMELQFGILWTTKFSEWFQKDHGYNPISWLPALTNWTLKDKETTDRFLYDYKKSLSDLLIFSHYITGSKVCHEYGLELCAEAGGPGPPISHLCPVDALKALGNVDIPRGEFWIKHRNMFLIKEVASASHIYGKKYVDAESWTTWRRWKDSPFVRKQIVDRAFCEGLNRVTYHGFASSPEEVGFPGRTYHAGVDMNPQIVWWSKARPFMDYLGRCCHMLQQGLFSADVAYYYGDQAPNFWPAYHDVPVKPLLSGLSENYDYDVVNSDVILNRMSVKNGKIILPDGMSYRVLVLPNQSHMPLEVLAKLEKMVAAGATIIGPKPLTVPGLNEHGIKNKKLHEIADRMWGRCDGKSVKSNVFGKGMVFSGITPNEWLSMEKISPDFLCLTAKDASHLDYIHRSTNDEEIYFVRNKSLTTISADCMFRVKGHHPQLWQPESGVIEPLYVYKQTETGTQVRLQIPAGGSVFVVFSKSSVNNRLNSLILKGEAVDVELPAATVVDCDIESASIKCWQNASYELTDKNGHKSQLVVDQLPTPQTIHGEWKVEFDPEWGAPAEVKMPKLISWTDHLDEGVKYYSGAGLYSKTLDITDDWLAEGRQVYLDLGDVRDVAQVYVNGKSAGILWKAPFRVDITSFVNAGANELKIEVLNQWINRLSGDLKLPKEKQFCRTNQIPWLKDMEEGSDETWHIQPAGLLGPVRLLPALEVTMGLKE